MPATAPRRSFDRLVVVVLDSVSGITDRYGTVLRVAQWIFTILFTIEYILRLISVGRPWRYATSFLGIVDLLAVVPTYLSLFVAGAASLVVIRALRLLRIFRIFKIARYVGEVSALTRAIRASGPKIVGFMFADRKSVV